MNNSYVIDASSVDVLKRSHLLLDTNFLIDALMFASEFADLLLRLRELECDLITTRSVIIEYLGGTHDTKSYKKKVDFLELMFGKPVGSIISLPVDSVPDEENLIAFSRQCNTFDPIDYELFLTMKKYHHSKILLMTRNHADFTTRLFKRSDFVTLLGAKQIRTYGLYSL